jgi:hypothetical protein
MLSAQEISTPRSPDMWRVNRMTPGLGWLAVAVGTNIADRPPRGSARKWETPFLLLEEGHFRKTNRREGRRLLHAAQL